jgi:Uncharacterized protein conserved in bacteria
MPPNASVAAVYLELTAHEPDQLLGAASPIADRVEIHQTSIENDMTRMRPVERLPLKRNERVTFAPGGTHIMLHGLDEPLAEGQRFPLELKLEKAGTIAIEVEVMAADADHVHH